MELCLKIMQIGCLDLKLHSRISVVLIWATFPDTDRLCNLTVEEGGSWKVFSVAIDMIISDKTVHCMPYVCACMKPLVCFTDVLLTKPVRWRDILFTSHLVDKTICWLTNQQIILSTKCPVSKSSRQRNILSANRLSAKRLFTWVKCCVLYAFRCSRQ